MHRVIQFVIVFNLVLNVLAGMLPYNGDSYMYKAVAAIA